MNGRRRAGWLPLALAVGACSEPAAPPPTAEVAPAPPPPPPAEPVSEREFEVYVYACPDGTRYTVAVGEEASLLLLPDGARRLPHVPAASGARYESEDGTLYWSKGREALLTIDGVEHAGCLSDATAAVWESARVRGVDYRAVGNEPGWSLEIVDGGRGRFETDDGEWAIEFDTPPPVDGGGPGAIDYVVTGGPRTLRILLRREPCHDPRADVAYPLRVRVETDGRIYEGCGQALGNSAG